MYLILKGVMYSNLSISLSCADSTNIWWSSFWGFFPKGASFSFWTDCFQTFKMFFFLPFFLLLKVAACGLLSGCLGQVLTQIISLSQICHPLALSFPFSRLFNKKIIAAPLWKEKYWQECKYSLLEEVIRFDGETPQGRGDLLRVSPFTLQSYSLTF